MTNTESIGIVDLLSKQEEAIASLYATFSAAVPEMKGFWNNLVVQEKAHSEVLQKLSKLCESKDVYLDKKRFNVAAVQTNIDSMRRTREKVVAEGITALRALSLAADIEQSLFEKNYFQIIQSDLKSVRQELDEIERHTSQHIAIVKQRLEEEKQVSHPPVAFNENTKERVIQSQRNIINSLVGCEDAISKLYTLYSASIPGLKDFWSDLAHQEEAHAKLLKTMHKQLDKGCIFYNIGRFGSESIDTFVKKVEGAIHQAETRTITPEEAVGTALSIEASIVDAHFYDIVQSDSKEYSIIAGRLSADTHSHVKAVRNKLEEILSNKAIDEAQSRRKTITRTEQ